jgi:Protein of unknown function (DUF1569)
MKSLFEESAKIEMLNRVDQLLPNAARQWGKMDVSQMVCHCARALEMAMGTINPKRAFIGRILGPIFKGQYSDDSAFGKNSPTSNELIVGNSPDFEQEKKRLKDLINQFSSNGEAGATKHPHPFFGPLTPAEWGKGMYKHLDHHLKQFSA